ncbi:MAG TPA: DUF3488 and transglutaminase-like domain-containing protein [Burkholderiales bacterium]|nr:DUF3488 and transglutaminase-like domain-containing protein [Burkholderiales bacterium]
MTPPPALRRSSVLWLLAAVAMVLAPHVLRQPISITIFVVVIWLWRGWLAWRGLSRPPKFLIIGLAVAGVVLTFKMYGTVFGREAGVALLQLMLVMKLLEMQSLRDAIIAVFLGFFVVLTNFLHSQTLLMGAYMLGVIWIFVVTLIALNRRDEPSFAALGKPAGAMLLQAAPLMLVFFLLVPRVQGPLWGMPKDNSLAVSGLSEEMSPGSIGNLALSDAIAFRAEFDGPIPPVRALYWRAIVMDDFDGRTWRANRPTFQSARTRIQGVGAPIGYHVTLEPHNRRWMFALDLPKDIPEGTRLADNYQLMSFRPVTARMRYEIKSHLNYRAGVESTNDDLDSSLELPPGNPRTVALAQFLKAQSATPQDTITRALAYFRSQRFLYTLEPPILAGEQVDEFVFESKSGFCEHYAGAFTFLMRAAGIPARVVTGYQGGEINPIGNYLIVRQADAHAWSEVWLSGRGWVRIDPTAAVSPTRVDEGIRAVVPATDFIPGLITAEQFKWLRSFQLSWDAVNNQWNQWVLGYNFDRQKQLLARLGQKDASWQDLTIALLIASAVAVLALSGYLLFRHARQRRDPVAAVYEKFCARLAKLGIARAPSEGPLDLASRAATASPELASAIQEITTLYTGLRYGMQQDVETLKSLKRLVGEFPRKAGSVKRE